MAMVRARFNLKHDHPTLIFITLVSLHKLGVTTSSLGVFPLCCRLSLCGRPLHLRYFLLGSPKT